MAIVYASSPVEQPAIQILSMPPSGLDWISPNSAGLRRSQAAGSRKNCVTPMSISLARISISGGLSWRYRT